MAKTQVGSSKVVKTRKTPLTKRKPILLPSGKSEKYWKRRVSTLMHRKRDVDDDLLIARTGEEQNFITAQDALTHLGNLRKAVYLLVRISDVYNGKRLKESEDALREILNK